MIAEPLETLLEKLSRGDMIAVERILSTYEPYLRMVVRRICPVGSAPSSTPWMSSSRSGFTF